MNIYIGIVLIVVVAFALGWAARSMMGDVLWGDDFDQQELDDTPQQVADYITKYREDQL